MRKFFVAIMPYKDFFMRRTFEYSEKYLSVGLKVKAYINLHNGLVSLIGKDSEGNTRVLAHVESVKLSNVTFPVADSTRSKIREYFQSTGKSNKTPHAYVVGIIVEWNGKVEALDGQFTYNPYRDLTFIDRTTKAPLTNASLAIVDSRSKHSYKV